MCACAGATQPADEAAGAAAEGEWSNSGEEGDYRPTPGDHGPQLPQTDLKGRTEARHAGPAAQDPGHTQGRRRGFCISAYVPEACCSVISCTVCLQQVVESEQVIRELQESQVSVSDRLAQQKQQLIELCGTSYVLDPDFVNLQDTKDRVRSTYCTVYCVTTQ